MKNDNNIERFGYDYVGGANAAEEYDRIEELKKHNLEAVYTGVKTYKIARYDGELENGKGKVYFFPYYLITSEKAIILSKNFNSDFVNITGIVGLKDYNNPYKNIYLIKKMDMAEKGFRALLLDLITKNLILLNNKKKKTIDPETIPEGIRLNNLINFWNRNKRLIDYHGKNLLLVNTFDGTYAVINVNDEYYASTLPTETERDTCTVAGRIAQSGIAYINALYYGRRMYASRNGRVSPKPDIYACSVRRAQSVAPSRYGRAVSLPAVHIAGGNHFARPGLP